MARTLSAGLPTLGTRATLEPAHINGSPALIVRIAGEIDDVLTLRIDDGLITALYVVRNPEKLSRLDQRTTVSR